MGVREPVVDRCSGMRSNQRRLIMNGERRQGVLSHE